MRELGKLGKSFLFVEIESGKGFLCLVVRVLFFETNCRSNWSSVYCTYSYYMSEYENVHEMLYVIL